MGLGIRQSGIAREELFVTTKVWNSDHGYDSTLKAFDLSMKKLGLEYLRSLFDHCPIRSSSAIAGKKRTRRPGRPWKSSISRAGFEPSASAISSRTTFFRILKSATILPMVKQMCLHPAQNQTEMVEYCEKLGIVLEAYSPLGTGALLKQPEILACAEKYGKIPGSDSPALEPAKGISAPAQIRHRPAHSRKHGYFLFRTGRRGRCASKRA